ncbi:DUF1737 domain-containing protein [Nonlabens sp. YIK11]|nr:DUF1737 domain-containing protein [Nonlabens sp. YIK11]
MKEYKILTSNTINGIQEYVTTYMNDGWKPQGGIRMISSVWHQAVIKE